MKLVKLLMVVVSTLVASQTALAVGPIEKGEQGTGMICANVAAKVEQRAIDAGHRATTPSGRSSQQSAQ